MTAPTGPQTPAVDDLPGTAAAQAPTAPDPTAADPTARDAVVVDLHAESLSVTTAERPYRRVVVRREVVTEEVSVVVTVRREVLRVEHEDLVDDVPGPFVLHTSQDLSALLAEAAPDGAGADPTHLAGPTGPPDPHGEQARRPRVPPRSFEVVLHEERPVVGVEVVPVERVVVRTVRREALGVVRAEVRHEEVELERSTATGAPSSAADR